MEKDYKLLVLMHNIQEDFCDLNKLYSKIINLIVNYSEDNNFEITNKCSKFFSIPYRLISKYKKYIGILCDSDTQIDYPFINNIDKYNISKNKFYYTKIENFYNLFTLNDEKIINDNDNFKKFKEFYSKDNCDIRNSYEHSFFYISINNIDIETKGNVMKLKYSFWLDNNKNKFYETIDLEEDLLKIKKFMEEIDTEFYSLIEIINTVIKLPEILLLGHCGIDKKTKEYNIYQVSATINILDILNNYITFTISKTKQIYKKEIEFIDYIVFGINNSNCMNNMSFVRNRYKLNDIITMSIFELGTYIYKNEKNPIAYYSKNIIFEDKKFITNFFNKDFSIYDDLFSMEIVSDMYTYNKLNGNDFLTYMEKSSNYIFLIEKFFNWTFQEKIVKNMGNLRYANIVENIIKNIKEKNLVLDRKIKIDCHELNNYLEHTHDKVYNENTKKSQTYFEICTYYILELLKSNNIDDNDIVNCARAIVRNTRKKYSNVIKILNEIKMDISTIQINDYLLRILFEKNNTIIIKKVCISNIDDILVKIYKINRNHIEDIIIWLMKIAHIDVCTENIKILDLYDIFKCIKIRILFDSELIKNFNIKN